MSENDNAEENQKKNGEKMENHKKKKAKKEEIKRRKSMYQSCQVSSTKASTPVTFCQTGRVNSIS